MEDFKPLLKNTKFVYLWTSQVLSQLTISIMNFLLLIRLFNATGSTIATSLLWVAYALPAIFIGPIASASVDMLERRKVLMFANLFQAAAIFGYGLIYDSQLFLIYGIAITYSFLNQFYVPAEAASLPSLVKKANLPQANGLFFLTQQSAIIIGFGVAGLLNQTIGYEKSVFLCAAFLLLAFFSVSFLPKDVVEDNIPGTFEKAFAKFFKRIIEGYHFIRKNNAILIPFLLLIVLQVGLTIIVVNVPLIGKELLNIQLNSTGTSIVVPAGIGALISASVIPGLLKKGWRKKKIIELGLLFIPLGLLSLAFLSTSFDYPLNLIVGLLSIVLIGFSFVSIIIPAQTMLQEVTPGGLRGRVFGNFWFLVTIATIFPVVFSGALAELFGIKMLLAVLGGLSFLVLFLAKKYGPQVIQGKIKIK